MSSKIKILVVDDVFAERKRIERWFIDYLLADTFEMTVKSKWKDTVELISNSEDPFDFIFTDVTFENQDDNNRGGKEIALAALKRGAKYNSITKIVFVSKVDRIGKWVRDLEKELNELEIISKPPESSQEEFNDKFRNEFIEWLKGNYRLSTKEEKITLLEILKIEALSGDEMVMLYTREWYLKNLFPFIDTKEKEGIKYIREAITNLTSFKNKSKEFTGEFETILPGFEQKWGHYEALFQEYNDKGYGIEKFKADFVAFNEVLKMKYYSSHELLQPFAEYIFNNTLNLRGCQAIIDEVSDIELRIDDNRVADDTNGWFLLITDWNKIQGCISANAKRHNSVVRFSYETTEDEIIITGKTEVLGFTENDRNKMAQSFSNHSIDVPCKIKQLSYIVCNVYEGVLQVCSKNSLGDFVFEVQSIYQPKIEWCKVNNAGYPENGTYYKIIFKR